MCALLWIGDLCRVFPSSLPTACWDAELLHDSKSNLILLILLWMVECINVSLPQVKAVSPRSMYFLPVLQGLTADRLTSEAMKRSQSVGQESIYGDFIHGYRTDSDSLHSSTHSSIIVSFWQSAALPVIFRAASIFNDTWSFLHFSCKTSCGFPNIVHYNYVLSTSVNMFFLFANIRQLDQFNNISNQYWPLSSSKKSRKLLFFCSWSLIQRHMSIPEIFLPFNACQKNKRMKEYQHCSLFPNRNKLIVLLWPFPFLVISFSFFLMFIFCFFCFILEMNKMKSLYKGVYEHILNTYAANLTASFKHVFVTSSVIWHWA